MAAMELDAFIAAHTELAWRWGEVDCSLVLADWAIANGRPDPAAHLRGIYDDEAGWRQIVARHGGLFPLVSDVCARAGIAQAAAPSRGVVAVIGSSHNIERQMGAIHDGERWQVRFPQGFARMAARALGMWAV